MSRLTGSDVRMMGDILSTNTQAVATLLALFRVQLALLEAMLISRDEENLAEALRPARAARLRWIEAYEKGMQHNGNNGSGAENPFRHQPEPGAARHGSRAGR
jgi:hypothetical protein